MSNTRRAKEGTPLRQERFCSSAEYERGLLGNLVAQRASLLNSDDERRLLFAIQYFSWQPGGLKKFTAAFLDRFADKIATLKMREFPRREHYSANQVKAIRAEFPTGEDNYPLTGEIRPTDFLLLPDIPAKDDRGYERAVDEHWLAKDTARQYPNSYPAKAFFESCMKTAREQLPDILTSVCLDPQCEVSKTRPFWCVDLVRRLQEFVERISAECVLKAETQISRGVFDGLEYCLSTGELTLIEGLAGMGKTFSAKVWCEQHAGQVRYIQVPTTTDDASFMRRIAEAFGVGCGLSMKGAEIREKVERTAKASKLMLVLDEAHYCLTSDYRARRRPSRIAWIMNELVNNGIPVALLTTPQFEEDKARIKERTGWNWDQFDRRIGVPIHLPTKLTPGELGGVAQAIFPEGDESAIKALVGYAIFSKSKLAAIDHVVKRARFEADKLGREVGVEDIMNAIDRRKPVDPEAPKLSMMTHDSKPTFQRGTAPKLTESRIGVYDIESAANSH